jgi:hypothetical protein
MVGGDINKRKRWLVYEKSMELNIFAFLKKAIHTSVKAVDNRKK